MHVRTRKKYQLFFTCNYFFDDTQISKRVSCKYPHAAILELGQFLRCEWYLRNFCRGREITNNTWLWGTELDYNSQSAGGPIGLYDLPHGLRIYGFRPIWLSLIVEALATRARFLAPSVCCAVVNAPSATTLQMFRIASAALWPSSNSYSESSRMLHVHLPSCHSSDFLSVLIQSADSCTSDYIIFLTWNSSYSSRIFTNFFSNFTIFSLRF